MRRGPEAGTIYPLEAEEIRIGRGTKNDIVIDDNEVSREHLHLIKIGGGYELHDLTETKHTYVNGQRVDGVWLLRSHCIIELGDSITIEYYMGEAEKHEEVERTGQSDASLASQYFMVVTTESQSEPAVYPLNGASIDVGRSTANDIVIVEPELSRQHFRLIRSRSGYSIEDMGSTNGTVVNGEVISQPHRLYPSDIITIGTSVQIQITNSPDEVANVAPTEILADTLARQRDPAHKRKTSQAEVAGVAGMMKKTTTASDIGTGVDHVSLEDQVLICYAREEWEAIIAPMVNTLFNAEIEAWVDQYLIQGSADWLVATEQARLECWMLVVVVSPAALELDWVKKTWRHFQNREKPIVLVIHKPVERLPIGARKLTRIQYNPGVPDIAFNQLVDEIKRLNSS